MICIHVGHSNPIDHHQTDQAVPLMTISDPSTYQPAISLVLSPQIVRSRIAPVLFVRFPHISVYLLDRSHRETSEAVTLKLLETANVFALAVFSSSSLPHQNNQNQRESDQTCHRWVARQNPPSDISDMNAIDPPVFVQPQCPQWMQ